MSNKNSKDTKKKIELTDTQYRDLIKLITLGNSVMGILGDVLEEPQYKKDSNRMEELEEYLLESAHNFNSLDLVEPFLDKIIIDQEYYEDIIRGAIELYEEYIFWNELEVQLGKCEFERTKTKEEVKAIEESGGMLPYRINEIYEKYNQEFTKHGIERLRIVKGKKAGKRNGAGDE